MTCLKLKKLEEYLQQVDGFVNPKVDLEQYVTMPHIASQMLYAVQSSFGDIDGKVVADLGCGCGVLSIGASLLGAKHCVGFDVDVEALQVFQANCEYFDIQNIDAVACNVNNIPVRYNNFFDCVIMNPPFGTKLKGADINFLNVALKLTNIVYSLHKTSTREHMLKKAQHLGADAKVIAQLRYDLPATYKFHKKTNVDVKVDFIRFTKNK